jgi:hypothetical protein
MCRRRAVIVALTINGGPACQVEGPARTQVTSWTSCGWTSSETCLRNGIRACEDLLMGTCPPDIMPGTSIISCR